MTEPLRILGISGSLRRASMNSGLLRAAAGLLPQGSALQTFDIATLPHYDDDLRASGVPEAVTRLHAAIVAAHAVVIATPEYNYSVPGVLKNVLDWASKCEPQPFHRKPVAIFGVSPEPAGTQLAQQHLRQIFLCLHARVMPEPELTVHAVDGVFDDAGNLRDGKVRHRISGFLQSFADWTAITR